MATRWKPDTCDCVIVFEMDGEAMRCVTVEHACDHHGAAGTEATKWKPEHAQLHLETVVAHNRARPDKLEG